MAGSYYPVFLDLRGRRCVVIGGGEIAQRKVEGLLECSAIVTLISPAVTEDLQRLADDGAFQWAARKYSKGDLKGAFLAIAATDVKAVNEEVAAEAGLENVVLNVVDDPPLCSFIAPAVVRRGQVTLAISTGGASPALARRLRETMETSGALDYADLAEILASARAQLKQRGLVVDPDRWQECITEDLVPLVNDGRSQQALDQLMARLENKATSLEKNVESANV